MKRLATPILLPGTDDHIVGIEFLFTYNPLRPKATIVALST